MKKTNWLMLAIFAALGMLLRVWQMLTGFDDAGLAIPGNVPALLLPVVLVASAVYFFAVTRTLPSQRETSPEFADCFRFRDMAAVFCAVSGSFLAMMGAAAAVMGFGRTLNSLLLVMLLAVIGIAAAVTTLHTVFALYRGNPVQGVELLVTVVALGLYFVFLYRADVSDPVLQQTYVEIIAGAALMSSALERAAFAFRNGSLRVYLPLGAAAAILALVAAAERQNLAAVLIFAGCALVELGFLAAAELKQ